MKKIFELVKQLNMKMFIKKIRAFSLAEVLLSLVIVSTITVAFTPVITNKLKSKSIDAKASIAVSQDCKDFSNSANGGTKDSSCGLCSFCDTSKLNRHCIICNCNCDYNGGYYKYTPTCTCEKCSERFDKCLKCDVSKCDLCQKGYYIAGGRCVKCEKGYYCPDGISRLDCREGKYCPEGASGETNCTAGKWGGKNRSTNCTDNCTAGYKCPGDGTRSQCPAGTWSAAGASSCTNCAAGKYSTAVGATSVNTCTNCAAGKWSAAGRGSACTDACGAGYWCINGAKTPCAAGTASSATTASAVSTCATCAAGKWSGQAASACSNCAAGKWSNAGSSSCTLNCAGGRRCPGDGTNPECSAGTYAPGGNSSCSGCAAMTCQTATGKTSCGACNTNCTACTASTCKCTSCKGVTNGWRSGDTCGTVNCNAGYRVNGASCTGCAAMTWKAAGTATSCTACNSNCTACNSTTGKCTSCKGVTNGKRSGDYCGTITCNSGYKLSGSTCIANCRANTIRVGNYCVTSKNVGDGMGIPGGASITWDRSGYLDSDGYNICANGATTTSDGCSGATNGGNYSGCSRTVCNWRAANAICSALGGRLPTASELTTWHKNNSYGKGNDGLQFCAAYDGTTGRPACNGGWGNSMCNNIYCSASDTWASDADGRYHKYVTFRSGNTTATYSDPNAQGKSVRCVFNN